MRFRSPIVLMPAVGLFTLGFLAPWGAPKAAADGDRLGCGTYCQDAGGYGAAGNAPQRPQAVTLENTGTAIADADGYVPVTLKCHRAVQCLGYVQVGVGNGGGSSDLVVNAGATRTIGVPMEPATIAYLRSHGPTQGNVIINAGARDLNQGRDWRDFYNDGFDALSLKNPLMVAAPG